MYRERYGTFEAFCQQRCGLNKGHESDFIVGSRETVAIATVDADAPRPTNLAQARALAGLNADEAADVMRQADEATDGNPTAKAIRETRDACRA